MYALENCEKSTETSCVLSRDRFPSSRIREKNGMRERERERGGGSLRARSRSEKIFSKCLKK